MKISRSFFQLGVVFSFFFIFDLALAAPKRKDLKRKTVSDDSSVAATMVDEGAEGAVAAAAEEAPAVVKAYALEDYGLPRLNHSHVDHPHDKLTKETRKKLVDVFISQNRFRADPDADLSRVDRSKRILVSNDTKLSGLVDRYANVRNITVENIVLGLMQNRLNSEKILFIKELLLHFGHSTNAWFIESLAYLIKRLKPHDFLEIIESEHNPTPFVFHEVMEFVSPQIREALIQKLLEFLSREQSPGTQITLSNEWAHLLNSSWIYTSPELKARVEVFLLSILAADQWNGIEFKISFISNRYNERAHISGLNKVKEIYDIFVRTGNVVLVSKFIDIWKDRLTRPYSGERNTWIESLKGLAKEDPNYTVLTQHALDHLPGAIVQSMIGTYGSTDGGPVASKSVFANIDFRNGHDIKYRNYVEHLDKDWKNGAFREFLLSLAFEKQGFSLESMSEDDGLAELQCQRIVDEVITTYQGMADHPTLSKNAKIALLITLIFPHSSEFSKFQNTPGLASIKKNWNLAHRIDVPIAVHLLRILKGLLNLNSKAGKYHSHYGEYNGWLSLIAGTPYFLHNYGRAKFEKVEEHRDYLGPCLTFLWSLVNIDSSAYHALLYQWASSSFDARIFEEEYKTNVSMVIPGKYLLSFLNKMVVEDDLVAILIYADWRRIRPEFDLLFKDAHTPGEEPDSAALAAVKQRLIVVDSAILNKFKEKLQTTEIRSILLAKQDDGFYKNVLAAVAANLPPIPPVARPVTGMDESDDSEEPEVLTPLARLNQQFELKILSHARFLLHEQYYFTLADQKKIGQSILSDELWKLIQKGRYDLLNPSFNRLFSADTVKNHERSKFILELAYELVKSSFELGTRHGYDQVFSKQTRDFIVRAYQMFLRTPSFVEQAWKDEKLPAFIKHFEFMLTQPLFGSLAFTTDVRLNFIRYFLEHKYLDYSFEKATQDLEIVAQALHSPDALGVFGAPQLDRLKKLEAKVRAVLLQLGAKDDSLEESLKPVRGPLPIQNGVVINPAHLIFSQDALDVPIKSDAELWDLYRSINFQNPEIPYFNHSCDWIEQLVENSDSLKPLAKECRAKQGTAEFSNVEWNSRVLSEFHVILKNIVDTKLGVFFALDPEKSMAVLTLSKEAFLMNQKRLSALVAHFQTLPIGVERNLGLQNLLVNVNACSTRQTEGIARAFYEWIHPSHSLSGLPLVKAFVEQVLFKKRSTILDSSAGWRVNTQMGGARIPFEAPKGTVHLSYYYRNLVGKLVGAIPPDSVLQQDKYGTVFGPSQRLTRAELVHKFFNEKYTPEIVVDAVFSELESYALTYINSAETEEKRREALAFLNNFLGVVTDGLHLRNHSVDETGKKVFTQDGVTQELPAELELIDFENFINRGVPSFSRRGVYNILMRIGILIPGNPAAPLEIEG